MRTADWLDMRSPDNNLRRCRSPAGRFVRICVWGCAILLTSIAGCILVPTPPIGINEIPAEQLKAVQPGRTTRTDVLMALGVPDERLREDRVFIYRWNRLRAVGGIGGAGAGVPIAIDDRFAFAIEFDREGRVIRAGDFSAFRDEDFRLARDAWLKDSREEQ